MISLDLILDPKAPSRRRLHVRLSAPLAVRNRTGAQGARGQERSSESSYSKCLHSLRLSTGDLSKPRAAETDALKDLLL